VPRKYVDAQPPPKKTAVIESRENVLDEATMD
jgi:hypothetical protein